MTNDELERRLMNLVRVGTVTEVDTKNTVCRVQTGGLTTDWLRWCPPRAGTARTWWAPSPGEQVIILAAGGELTTAFVAGSLYSQAHPASCDSAAACHLHFPDGAVLEYEPATGALTVTGIRTAVVTAKKQIEATAPDVTVTAADHIRLNTPQVVCSDHLSCATLSVTKGGTLTGNIRHQGGQFTSNGVVADKHTHGGVKSGGSRTGGPQ